jgi:membrane protease subunit (stomatin/prohibitin family)
MAIIGGDKKSIIGAATLAWDDAEKRDNIMWKVPRNIKLNDNIVVREDEYAVFYRDGKALDYIDRPDRYALTSMNAPIVGKLVEFLSGVRQDAEVYYLQKRVFDGKFGSKQPYVFRDKDFGMVNLRVFGEFRYKVSQPANFINQFVGTFNYTTSAEVEDRIKEQLILVLYDVLGDAKNKGLGVADLAANLTNLEQALLERLKPHFDLYGILVEKLSGLYINLPEEVQKAVDTRSSMGVLGTNYMQYQAGQAMREAAQNTSGGAAGAGVGVGAGFGLGYGMVDQMRQGMQQQPQQQQQQQQQAQQPAAAAAAGTPCAKCGAIVPPGAKFCPSCGEKQAAAAFCPNCGAQMPAGARFCPSCGQKIG